MYVIAAIGVLTMLLSGLMLASPKAWAAGILAFARKPCFHIAEILTRLLVGGMLVLYAGQTQHPSLFAFAGYVLLGVGVFLTLAGATRHRVFAVRSASFGALFRPAGLVGVLAGAFVVHAALAGPG